MKVLIAEDDQHTREGLMEIFKNEGFQTWGAENGKKALKLFEKVTPDIVCLDIMMPEMDGYEVCRNIRSQNTETGIIFISAKSEEIDTVLGLELGADDYIVKPFSIKEVVARIKAIKRRLGRAESGANKAAIKKKPYTMLNLKVVPNELRVYKNDSAIDISARDIKILELFFQNKGKVLDRNTIFDTCWGLDYIPNSRTLDQHISQLRKKIEDNPKAPQIIKTVQGLGYRFE